MWQLATFWCGTWPLFGVELGRISGFGLPAIAAILRLPVKLRQQLVIYQLNIHIRSIRFIRVRPLIAALIPCLTRDLRNLLNCL